MTTAFRPRLDMMHVDERRVVAARHTATVSIAREHGATQRGRDALLRARARMSVPSGDWGCAAGAIAHSLALHTHVGVVRPLVASGARVTARLDADARVLIRRWELGEVLRVAGGHADNRRIDRHQLT